MNALKSLKQSNAWSSLYNLPLCPEANNPHFYLALSSHILFKHSEFLPEGLIQNYQSLCEKEPGLFNRWPDTTGGKISHDELIGIAYLNNEAAKRVLNYIETMDGDYNNVEKPSPIGKNNLYRMPWFICYLRARAGLPINILNYSTYILRMIQDILFYNYSKNRNEDSCLQTWIMHREMKRFKTADYVYSVWVKRMEKRAVNPQKLFETYLADHPWFRNYSGVSWL